jgi:hypothetical protein
MKRIRNDEKYDDIQTMFCFNSIEYYWLITSLNTNFKSIETIDIMKKAPSRYIKYLETIEFGQEYDYIKSKLENYLKNLNDKEFYENFIEMKNIDNIIYNVINDHNPTKRQKLQ